MRRTACVDLPFFPLQVLLRRRPEWRERPVAVVDADRPQGRVLWINDRARAARVLPGMRYATALALERDLRAAVVPEEAIRDEVAAIRRRLVRHTPNVEPAADEPGVFRLDASGLERLHPSLKDWGAHVRADLERAGFRATVVVGFDRFGTYALARGRRGLLVLASPADERAAARRVPLDRLALPPAARDVLARLGVANVGQFLDLPAEGLVRRFGPDVARLHRAASGLLDEPLRPERPAPPAVRRARFDHGETNVGRLLAAVEGLLGPVVGEVDARGRNVGELALGLRFECLGEHVETVRPAEPTRDAARLFELIRLRLEAVRRLPDAVEEVVLLAREAPASPRQTTLFAARARRDLVAANRALARVRAALGDDAVVRARPREGHLPEGRFDWERLAALEPAAPAAHAVPRLVRRIRLRPAPLPRRARREPDGWLLRGLEHGPVDRLVGPYVVSGGWWHRPVHREYHFAETRDGELLWVYWDLPRRQWFLHGRVE